MAKSAVTLRQWTDSDAVPFAEMNRDPEVMRHFPRPLSDAESLEALNRQRTLICERGWGLWAVEVEGAFAGISGLAVPRFTAAFTPCVEIGWRFRTEYWGMGIAQASARCVLAHGFGVLGLPEIVSFTAAVNDRSRRLMERIGLRRDPSGDFMHPSIDPASPICLHVLYRGRPETVGPPTPGLPLASMN